MSEQSLERPWSRRAACGRGFTACRRCGVTGISIDTRTLQPGDLFFAIQWRPRDGHDYVGAAFERGAVAAVVDEAHAEALKDLGTLYVVHDVLQALEGLGTARAQAQQGADHRRDRLGRQDLDQGSAAKSPVRRRPDPRRGQVLQQSLGRAADARPPAGKRALRRIRDRHEPRRRDRALWSIWSARMSPSSPMSRRSISNISPASRPSPAPRPRFFPGSSRAASRSSTAISSTFPILQAAAEASPAGYVLSFGENLAADAHLIEFEPRTDFSRGSPRACWARTCISARRAGQPHGDQRARRSARRPRGRARLSRRRRFARRCRAAAGTRRARVRCGATAKIPRAPSC